MLFTVSYIGILFLVLVYAIHGIIWGIATNKVLKNRGYDDNWFGWGFFFGLVALLVALSKPEQNRTAPVSYAEHPLMKNQLEADVLNNGGWKCSACGSVNAHNVTTCSCGKSKE